MILDFSKLQHQIDKRNKEANHERLLIVLSLLLAATTALAQSSDERELRNIAQSLLDALAHGDTMAWERNLHRDFVLTDESGKLVTRSALLSHLGALQPNATDRIRIGSAVVRRVGNVAVIHHRDREHAEIAGQKIEAEYQTTDTYVKVGGQWKLIASHVMALPRPRKAAAVEIAKLREAEGTFEIAPGVTYTVRLDADALLGERSDGKAERLLPAAADVFFPAGSVREEKVLSRDAAGNVIALIDRRDNSDIVWRKVR